MKIAANETILTGRWATLEGRVVADGTSERVQELIRSHLRELGRDASGWEALYRDPEDGRFWELTYPLSDAHGGGPPQLRCITGDQARKKYGDAVLL
jgi:hypothetical protein